MSRLVGGRGNKAPWETEMVRTPEPIKSGVQRYINDWKESQIDPAHIRQTALISEAQVRPLIQKILRQKKSARVSLLMLLSELGLEIDL